METYLGRKFGKLTLQEELDFKVRPKGKGRLRYFLCRCECGENKKVCLFHLRTGHTTSCGCAKIPAIKSANTRHGQARSKVWRAWESMRSRCRNPNTTHFKHYGGKGIKVCERWEKFENFFEDMGDLPAPRYTIERRDPNGDYEPSNCYWATWTEQANNRTNTVRITLDGRTQSATLWAREFGINPKTVLSRVAAGWDSEKALTYPLRKTKR